ncbi:hypothetical protein DDZ13_07640 [Coraliomargarita sinensis]|uniref:Uncharacterized protein n=1 Tax=Coraliomargarita sinensis TaxID=2174842 RepID=A0A317ZFN5_9BACT|nr:hypothetical protein DDZ13_07640 [Coraliomargarita sinensis]
MTEAAQDDKTGQEVKTSHVIIFVVVASGTEEGVIPSATSVYFILYGQSHPAVSGSLVTV